MAREAGAKKVYFASAAPAVKYPNVYGIDMPSASELIAHDRTEEEIREAIGADWLIYQDLDDLVESCQGGNPDITQFDCSVFNGQYITQDVTEDYLHSLEESRSDDKKASNEKKRGSDDESFVDLYNHDA
jgi:amidophosphoribosyltransferase